MHDGFVDMLDTRIPQVENHDEIVLIARNVSLSSSQSLLLKNLLALVSLSNVSHVFLDELIDGNASLQVRVDGLVVTVGIIQPSLHRGLLEEIIARINTTNTDEQIRFKQGIITNVIEDTTDNYWVGILQTSTGKQLTLQAIQQNSTNTPIDNWSESCREDLEKIRRHPCGLILFCSRAWSTNSVAMTIWLAALATDGGRCAYVTDGPIKMNLPQNICHLHVTNQSESLGAALGALVAQDFDVIALGCRDDKEAVSEAVRTSLEDRYVLVNLPTNGVLDTLSWLVSDSSVDNYHISQVLIGIVGEPRTFRRVCSHCSYQTVLDQELLATLQANGIDTSLDEQWTHSSGCSKCNHTGFVPKYDEWLRVIEAVYIDTQLAGMLILSPTRAQLVEALKQRTFVSYFEQGIKMAKQGFTTPQEALRVGLARRADM